MERPGVTTDDIGYRARLLWASLIAVGLVDCLYFAVVLFRWSQGDPLLAKGLVALLLIIAGVLVAIEVLFVLANRAYREPMDERDEAIAGSSARLAYGVFIAGVCLLYTSPSPRDLSTSRMPSSA